MHDWNQKSSCIFVCTQCIYIALRGQPHATSILNNTQKNSWKCTHICTYKTYMHIYAHLSTKIILGRVCTMWFESQTYWIVVGTCFIAASAYICMLACAYIRMHATQVKCAQLHHCMCVSAMMQAHTSCTHKTHAHAHMLEKLAGPPRSFECFNKFSGTVTVWPWPWHTHSWQGHEIPQEFKDVADYEQWDWIKVCMTECMNLYVYLYACTCVSTGI